MDITAQNIRIEATLRNAWLTGAMSKDDFEAACRLITAGENAPAALHPDLPAPNTYGGFRGAFYVAHRRAPTEQEVFYAGVRSALRRNGDSPPAAQHTDDIAIDRFAAVLKEKMAESRAKGRSGWEGCDPAMLAGMLREHVEKGDPRDVALLSMMLWWHSAKTNAVAPSTDADAWWAREGHRGVFPHGDRRGWEGAAKYGFDAGKRAAGQQTTTGHCERAGGCVCGGDLPRVREGCSNWVKGT